MNTSEQSAAGSPIQYEKYAGPLLGHLGQVNQMTEDAGLSRKLSHLIELRVSQINRCGFCVQMHAREARKDGETDNRLDHLATWESTDDFSAAEKAALAWAEALTYMIRGTNFEALRADLRAHFTDQQISLITVCVGMINLWNRIQISKH
ncbi:carboxymuconolactone decarboxylase family protein [uncultured Roseobacter sp.]|uniref:carboxymuconolactone decarboxylase family protein n=1 Tax=uncultured Roseobacter sp. TaxID=114847 RepID=UPI002615888E|nr:carboxymuconolactone decarboxylase family protein [uncultured Roseobacter sp.]